ncbi:MAG: hypothetical protein LBG28_10425 [Tannerella sp.]|nr:hypothetical protein [Tannerella sp.]
MRKYRTQSLTGIFALAFGLACFVPALYWLRYETSYDSFYPGAENIYRIYLYEKQSGKLNELVSRRQCRIHCRCTGSDDANAFC